MSLRARVLKQSVFSYTRTVLANLTLAYVLPHGKVLKKTHAKPDDAHYVVWFLNQMDIPAAYDEENALLWVTL